MTRKRTVGCRCPAAPKGRRAIGTPEALVLAEAKIAYADASAEMMNAREAERAYNKRQLQWRASWSLPSAALCRVVKNILAHGYGEFSASRVCKWISQPQHAGVHWVFGREYSPVLYAKGEMALLKVLARSAKRSVKADEVDFRADGSLRLWWD